ncbi:MAG: hypothetical protein LBJ58_03530 [Tannerellaceae bacterium]|nr:hypothetical protein [Tannerellaceae bacterium]
MHNKSNNTAAMNRASNIALAAAASYTMDIHGAKRISNIRNKNKTLTRILNTFFVVSMA